MCGGSEFKIKNTEIDLYIGYCAGRIEVNGIIYERQEDDEPVHNINLNRDAVKKELAKLSKKDLVEAFVLLAENGEEG